MWTFDFDDRNPARARLQKVTLTALFAALAVLLSPLSFPVGPARCAPFQHSISVIAGIVLGPWWACGAAFTASLIRNIMGTGTILAFPGSVFGALAVGFAAKLLPAKLRPLGALAEPLATATLGAWTASLIASTATNRPAMFLTLSVAFLISSGPGSVIGYAVLRILQRQNGNVSATGQIRGGHTP